MKSYHMKDTAIKISSIQVMKSLSEIPAIIDHRVMKQLNNLLSMHHKIPLLGDCITDLEPELITFCGLVSLKWNKKALKDHCGKHINFVIAQCYDSIRV